MKYDRNFPLKGFAFKKVSYGAYEVTYESDYDFFVGRYWVARIEDMTLIDATKNAENVKRKDVEALLRVIKRKGTCNHYH